MSIYPPFHAYQEFSGSNYLRNLFRFCVINVYAKNEKDDLTEDEKKAFKAVIKILKEE